MFANIIVVVWVGASCSCLIGRWRNCHTNNVAFDIQYINYSWAIFIFLLPEIVSYLYSHVLFSIFVDLAFPLSCKCLFPLDAKVWEPGQKCSPTYPLIMRVVRVHLYQILVESLPDRIHLLPAVEFETINWNRLLRSNQTCPSNLKAAHQPTLTDLGSSHPPTSPPPTTSRPPSPALITSRWPRAYKIVVCLNSQTREDSRTLRSPCKLRVILSRIITVHFTRTDLKREHVDGEICCPRWVELSLAVFRRMSSGEGLSS